MIEIRDYEMDLFGLEPLIRHGEDSYACGCNRTYMNTNERLKDIYSNFDFNGKDVFSVMSSADQVFSAYYLGAKSVDTFDRNWTCYYNFYLKKWFLMYYKDYILDTDSKKLLKALKMCDISSEEEKNVCKVWEELFIKYSDISKIFHSKDIYTWNLPFENDIEGLVKLIRYKKANYVDLNLFRNVNVDKKYDIVILSNILEYLSPDSPLNQVICNNLSKILNKEGIVICTILNDGYGRYMVERDNFKAYFDYFVSDKKGYNNIAKKEFPMYYVYVKK